MLKKFWRFLWGAPEPDTTLEVLRIIVSNQEKSQVAMMNAVQATVAASEKQAEVLTNYLKLFQTPGDPSHWTEPTPEEEGEQSMKEMGFNPKGDWTETQQAEWTLANLHRL